MRENNILDPEVRLNDMAGMTKNYTGAEIAGVVKAASSYAFNRHIKVRLFRGIRVVPCSPHQLLGYAFRLRM